MAPTPRSAATQAPPELISEHGKGQMTVPKKTIKVAAHTRQVKDNSKAPPVIDPITEQVNAAQLPQLQAIQAAQAASTLAAKNAATTTSGYYGALGDLLKGVAPQVQDTYRSAAGDTAAFGKGFSDGMNHVQSGLQGEAANAAGISGGAAPPPTSPAAGNALYALGGYIPASTLEREGAAFSSAAAGLPGAAVGQGAGALAKIGADEQAAQQGFGTKLTDLAAQVPGLRLQYQAQADALKAKADVLTQHKAEVAQHELDVAKQLRLQEIAATGVDPVTHKLTAKAQLEWDKVSNAMTIAQVNARTAQGRLAVAKVNAETAAAHLSLAQQKAFSDMYGVDAKGNLTLPGRRAALAQWKAEHPAAKGGYTKNQIAKLSNTAASLADTYFYGTPDKGLTKGLPAVQDYQQALKLELSHGIPLAIAQRALNALYPIGKEGRPWVDVSGRMLLQNAGIPMTDELGRPSKRQAEYLNQHGHPYHGETGPDTTVTPWPPPAK